MAIAETTIKRLFAKSHNQCAMPKCTGSLVIGDCVVGEICHIRARNKGGARYDPALMLAQKDDFKNLILLCGTCHKLVDKAPDTYSPVLLEEIKALHEAGASMEINAEAARQALLMLVKHKTKGKKTVAQLSVQRNTNASASHGGVAVSIGGHNQASINIHTGTRQRRTGTYYPPNSIGADANMTNYVEYLCSLYVDYMATIDKDRDGLYGRLGKHIKDRFRLKKKTRNHLSADRFFALVDFLIYEKLSRTPVGMKHLRNGTKLCRTFDEFRYAPM